MDDAEKEQVRTRTDIVELISTHTALKRSGSRFKGLCPFHQEKTPSFTVDPERGRYHCFGCGESGDVFTFIEKMEGLSFLEAAERLAMRAGITLSKRGGDREEDRRVRDERDRLYAANAAAMQFFRDAYKKASLAQEYTEKQRGLIHETRENFAVGYAPDDWQQLANYLYRQKIHADDAVTAGLIMPSRRGDGSYTDRFRGRLMFPIFDIQERVVGFGGRLIVPKEDAPKYLNSPETPVFSKSKTLYAMNRAKKAIQDRDLAVIVEGYMDVVAAHQAGIPFVVATLGTAMTEEHIRLLRRYTKNIALSFDADAAGVKAALRAAELIAASGTDMVLRVLALPPGDDPDSLIRSGNVAAFHKAIDSALTVPEFRLRSLENQHDLRADAGRMSYLREAVGIIASIPSLMEQDRLIRLVAVRHPSYSQNALRTEELIRAEVQRTRPAKSGAPGDDPLGDALTLPPPNRRGGPTAYQRNGNGYGGNGQGGGRNGYSKGGGGNGGRGNYGNKMPDRPYVQPDNVPIPVMRSALEEAERTIFRALVDDTWSPVLRKFAQDHLPPIHADVHIAELVRALWDLVTGGFTPSQALNQLSDERLLTFADTVLMDATGPELSEQWIIEALKTVLVARNEVAVRSVIAAPPDELTNEQLLEWTAKKRANPKISSTPEEKAT